MYKDKNGKVVASLTEVKNKTGDIFALVDEFGEIYLSSYNKIRYVIKKTGISDFIDLQEKETKEVPDRPVKVKKEVVKAVHKEVVREVAREEAPVKQSKKESNDEIEVNIDFVEWNRENKHEVSHVKDITKPLVEN
jgi:hypothetical protein